MSRIYWFYCGVYGLYIAVGAGLIVDGALQHGSIAPLVTGIVISVLGIPPSHLYLELVLRPLMTDSSVLRIPKAIGPLFAMQVRAIRPLRRAY